MLAATRAGCAALGVTTGSNDSTALVAAGADAIIDSLDDFPAWLRNWVTAPTHPQKR